MYASLIGTGVDGVRLFTDETVRRASTALADGPDEVMGINSRFGPGFYLHMEAGNMVQDGAFGHGAPAARSASRTRRRTSVSATS